MDDNLWNEMADDLRSALSDGIDPESVTFEAESVKVFGSAALDTAIESVAGDAESQRIGYRFVCDLLATRLAQGANQVLGCVLIDGEPDPAALAFALDLMLRSDGTFTPVLPLSADQARDLVDSGVSLFDVVDPATALLEVAASRSPITDETAETVLSEIDELVARHTAPS